VTTGHWEHDNEIPDINQWQGFIYKITNKITGDFYYGKKFFWSTTRKRIKGRSNRKLIRKESNWKTYESSSGDVHEAIRRDSKANFQFQIISLHETKGSLAYAEALRILPNLSNPHCYNHICPAIKFKVKLPTIRDIMDNIINLVMTETLS